MIDTIDIYRALKKKIEANFTAPVFIKDEKMPEPPCFYIKYVAGTHTQTAEVCEREQCTFDIIYFAENENLLDLLQKKKELKRMFMKPLPVTLRITDIEFKQYQEIDSIQFNLNEDDYDLHCMLSMTIDQSDRTEAQAGGTFDNRYDEYDNNEFMKDLELNRKE